MVVGVVHHLRPLHLQPVLHLRLLHLRPVLHLRLVLVVLMRLVQPFFYNGACGFVGIFRSSAPCCR